MGDFTPIGGFVGGLLIGLAVAMMLLLNGRVAGISGIVGGLLTLRSGVGSGRLPSSPASFSAPWATSRRRTCP